MALLKKKVLIKWLVDKFSKDKRSYIMSRIKSSETKPEILIRKYLFSKGFRYRKNLKTLPGNPDIVLKKYKTIIFVNGCFWHGHKNCNASKLPTTRKTFWSNKIKGNIDRDKKNIRTLRKLGWKVIVIWQCRLNNKVKLEKICSKLSSSIPR